MDVLVFDEGTDLPIQHPVKLGAEDDEKAEMPVHGEEPCPAVASFGGPVPRIEEQLRLIDEEEDGVLLTGLSPEVFLRKGDQPVRF